MSDIHILKTPQRSGQRHVTAIYHVPIDQTGNNYPGGQISQLSTVHEDGTVDLGPISQAEHDALQGGSVWEARHTFRFQAGMTVADMAAAVEAHWHVVAADEQERIDTEYEHYLATLNRS